MTDRTIADDLEFEAQAAKQDLRRMTLDYADQLDWLARDLQEEAREMRARAEGESTVFRSLGVVQGHGADLDRKAGQVYAKEQEVVRLRWLADRAEGKPECLPCSDGTCEEHQR